MKHLRDDFYLFCYWVLTSRRVELAATVTLVAIAGYVMTLLLRAALHDLGAH